MRDAAIDAAFDKAPGSVCAQCSGWGRSFSLEIADWEVEKDADGKEIEPEPLK